MHRLITFSWNSFDGKEEEKGGIKSISFSLFLLKRFRFTYAMNRISLLLNLFYIFKFITAEFKVSMYCNACERTVAKAISKCKGVEKFTTDMKKHKVVVMGRFDPQKVVKKLKKKTGKRVEIVENKEKTPTASNGQDLVPEQVVSDPPMFDYCKETQVLLMMFSDENPNACSIM